MQTITLQVDDGFLQILQNFLSQYPKEKISIKEDAIAIEIAKRIKEVDDGTMKMIPLEEGMNKLRVTLKSRF